MANKYFQQFYFSLIKKLTSIKGKVSLVQQVRASAELSGVTFLADLYGTVGNGYSVEFTGGATAGAEVVTVVGTAITVQIETGVSTQTQVKTAVDASAPASALISCSVASGGTAVVVTALENLVGGIDGVVAGYAIPGVTTIEQTGVGEFTFTLDDKYPALVGMSLQLLKSTAQDLVPQVKSQTVATTKLIVVNLLTGATPTSPTAACDLYVNFEFRNSDVAY